jgi:25S rRNA (cytosine2278-C5)-methyltransferase
LDHFTPKKYFERYQATMSLYYEAAAALANDNNAGGSLKSRIYRQKDIKSSPAQLFAVISEASKWSLVLKDVIEQSGLLAAEKKVDSCP